MREPLISKFVDDPESLSEDELSELLEALRQDPELVAKLKTHLELNELLSRRGPGRSDLLAQVACRVEEEGAGPLDPSAIKVEAERREGRLGRPAFPQWFPSLAAAALLVVGALAYLLSGGPQSQLAGGGSPTPSTSKIPAPSSTPVQTPRPTPAQTPTPTPPPVQTPTPPPVQTPTPTPVQTATPTPVQTPRPTPQPSLVPGPGPGTENRGPRVESLAGRIRVTEKGVPERTLALGDLVGPKHTLIAEAGASATIAYSDSTTLTLARQAVLRLETSPKRVFLQGGTLVAEVAKQDRDMVLETPHAEVRVLGTRFVLDAAESSTRVQVDSGLIRLKSRSSRRSIKVSAGEYARAARGVRLAARPIRATQGLLVLYDFRAGQGTTIRDRSGQPQPLDLKIESPQAVTWLPQGGLQLREPAQIVSERPAKEVVEQVVGTQELSVEAWIRPSQARVRGTEIRRVLALSLGYDDKNFQFGQLEDTFAGLVRPNLGPAKYDLLRAARKSARPGLTHVVFTRDPQKLQLYVNGRLSSSKAAEGDFKTWDRRFFLRLGGARPGAPEADSGATSWLGTYHLLAVYGRALSPADVKRNFESRF